MSFKDIQQKQLDSAPKYLIEAGVYVARCYALVDEGTHERVDFTDKTKMKKKHEIRLTFELPTVTRVFEEGKGQQPCVLGKKYTLSFHEKSQLTKDLMSWIGNKRPDGDLACWLDKEVVGTPAMINVTHNEVGGKKYANIVSITPLPKGMLCPDQVNKSIKFEIDPWNQKTFDMLPAWQQQIIKESDEWKATEGKKPASVEDLPF